MIRKLYERVYDHGGKDKKLHMLKHSYEKHANVLLKIPDTGKWILKEYLQMKTFESPFVKELCRSLNTQENSLALKVSN